MIDKEHKPLFYISEPPKPTATITVPNEAGLLDLATSRFMTAELLQSILNRNDIQFRVMQDGQEVGNLVNLKGVRVTGVEAYKSQLSVHITWDETT